MEKNFVLNGNKLIVKFMGFKINDNQVLNFKNHDKLDFKYLHYNLSWDWLMPCCKKAIKIYGEKNVKI